MAITIGRIDNKFGDNSSYKQPNTFPIYDKQKVLARARPSLNSFISGDIYLEGGDWNHCLYKGVYYALKILRILDPEKDLYHYRLEREMGFDVLKANARVIGDLTTTSDEGLMEEHIHKTIGILDNPTRVTTINFKVAEENVSKPFNRTVVVKITKDVRQEVLSKRKFDDFGNKVHTPFDGEEINRKYYSGVRNPGVFILGRLDAETKKISGGKDKVKDKINEFLDTLKDKQDELRISKVSKPENSKLKGKYVITWKEDGIGTTVEKFEIPLIDLSGLTDIVSLNDETLKETEPTTPLSLVEGGKGGLFGTLEGAEYYVDKEEGPGYEEGHGKIASISRTPVGASKETGAQLPIFELRYDDPGIKGKGARPPQIIQGSYDGREGQANLGGKDNLNGILLDGKQNFYEHNVDRRWQLPFGWMVAVAEMHLEGAGSESYDGSIKDKISHIPFSYPWITTTNTSDFRTWSNYYITTTNYIPEAVDPFGFVGKNERPSLGFLMFQNNKVIGDGDLFEYKASSKLGRIAYCSGISKDFFKYYSQKDHFGSNLQESSEPYSREVLARIQPIFSQAFVRAYLDNYHLGGLATLPQPHKKNGVVSWVTGSSLIAIGTFTTNLGQTDLVKDGDPYGIYNFGGNRTYTFQQIRADMSFYKDGSYYHETSPLGSEASLRAFKIKKGRNLSSKLLGDEIELPKGFEIAPGDYFFSDIDYTIKRYPKILFPERGKIDATIERPFLGVMLINSAKNEDNIMPITETPDSGIFLCTRKDGKLDLRILKTFERKLKLSKSPLQTVTSVDGVQERNTKFFLMKAGYVIDPKLGLTELQKLNVLRDLYESLKIPVSRPAEDPKSNVPPAGLWYTEDDLENKQLLFDLEGTHGYCVLHKGKVSLIAKEAHLLKAPEGDAYYLDHSENKQYTSAEDPAQPITTLEKVNQKVQFRFLTSSYDLNGKTNFDNSDFLSVHFRKAKATELETLQDHYFVSLDSKHDVIGGETLAVSKEENDKKGVQLAAGIEVERINLEILNSQRMYQANQGRHLLSQKRMDENIRRAQVQLDIQKMQADLNFSTGFISSLIGGSVELGLGSKAINEFANTGTGSDRGVDAFSLDPEELSAASGFRLNTRRRQYQANIGNRRKQGIDTDAVWRGRSNAVNKGTSMARLVGNYIIQKEHSFPEQQRKINMDKKLAAEQLALNSLQFNTKHMNEQINAQLELNRLFTRYDVPMISSRNIDKEFRENVEMHGKKLGEYYLTVYTPSAEQMKYLKEYVDEFGVGCDIPDIEYGFHAGMSPGIIRYRNIEDQGIRGITNVAIREYLKTRLTVGVKVVELAPATPDEGCLTLGQFKELLSNIKIETDQEKKVLTDQIAGAVAVIDRAATGYQISLSGGQTLEAKLKGALDKIKEHNDAKIADAAGAALTEIKKALELPEESTPAQVNEKLATLKRGLKDCKDLKKGVTDKLEIDNESDKDQVIQSIQSKIEALGNYDAFKRGLTTSLGGPDTKSTDEINIEFTNRINSLKEYDKIKNALITKKVAEAEKAWKMPAAPANATPAQIAQRVLRDLVGYDSYRKLEQDLGNTLERTEKKNSDIIRREVKKNFDAVKANAARDEEIKKALEIDEVTIEKINDKIHEKSTEHGLGLSCKAFRIMAGHNKYDFTDSKTMKNIEKLCIAVSVTLKYMYEFRLDQIFTGFNNNLQPVFKDLYELAENDLITKFMDNIFDSGDWYDKTIRAGIKEEAGDQEPPVIQNQDNPDVEIPKDSVFLDYTSVQNDGRLFRGTDKDLVNAGEILNIDLGGPTGGTYEAKRKIAFTELTTANLNHLKELLETLSFTLEAATHGYFKDGRGFIDMNIFDYAGRSDRCKDVLNTMRCEEVNFLRLCYSFLRFYNRIWPTVEGTDVPYALVMENYLRKAKSCGDKDIMIFDEKLGVTKETIYPAIGLYDYNPKGPRGAVGEKSIRKGEIRRAFSNGGSSSGSNDGNNVPVNEGELYTMRVGKPGYTKRGFPCSGVTARIRSPVSGLGKKDFYLSVKSDDVQLNDFYRARYVFFNKVIQHLDKILEDYQPRKYRITSTTFYHGTGNLESHFTGASEEHSIYVAAYELDANREMDSIFGLETGKYALAHLLTLSKFKLRWFLAGGADNEYMIIRLLSSGYKIRKSGDRNVVTQTFEKGDNDKFIRHCKDLINEGQFDISPDFADAASLYRWIYANLKTGKDPTYGTQMHNMIASASNCGIPDALGGLPDHMRT